MSELTVADVHAIEQLAMFMQARDMRIFGAETADGSLHPTWEEIGAPGQDEYVKDATAYVAAMRLLGWAPRKEQQHD